MGAKGVYSMLGAKAKVSIYGAVTGCGICIGNLKDTLQGHSTVFVVLKNKPKDAVFNAVVIALAFDSNEKVKRLILAPEEDTVFYEPELKLMLHKINGFTFSRLSCLYEKSCGAVIFHRLYDEPKVLLVKNKNGRYWSFPKGHIERNESEEQTALREIKEETGLSVKIVRGFRETSDYCPFGKVRKKVVFFLTEASTDKVKIQADEIDYSIWVDFTEAKNMCCYENDIKVLKRAEEIVETLY